MAVGLMTLIWAVSASAEDQTKIVTVTFTLQDTVAMELDTANVNFGQVSPSGDKGVHEKISAHKIKVRANKKWKLTAQANDDFKDATQGYVIPIKQLKLRKANDNYQAFPSKNATVVVANGEVTTNQGIDVSMDYQLDVLWENAAGNYSTQIVYTLSVNP